MKSALLFIFLFASAEFYGQSFSEQALALGVDDVAVPMGLMGGGVAIFDYDNDQWQDIYICGGLTRDRLYHNLGDGTFEELGLEAGILATAEANTTGVVVADYDNDGDQDIFLSTSRYTSGNAMAPCMLWENNGDGTFTDVSVDLEINEPIYSFTANFLDINGDGWLDIHVGGYIDNVQFIIDPETGQITGFGHECYEDLLYLSDGYGNFIESASSLGMNNEGCVLALSNVHLKSGVPEPSLYIANDFGQFISPNKVYSTSGETVAEEAELLGLNQGLYGMGIASADVNGDGVFDQYVTNMGPDILMVSNLDTFDDQSLVRGVINEPINGLIHTGWGCAFVDVESDGDPDLYVVNGHMPTIPMLENVVFDQNQLYMNDGAGYFSNASAQSSLNDEGVGRGCAIGDLDNDGDQDIVLSNLYQEEFVYDDRVRIYLNETPQANWVQVRLQGNMNTVNRDGIGAVVVVHTDEGEFIAELTGGGSYASAHSKVLHVGVGNAQSIEFVEVRWPDGCVEEFDNIPLNESVLLSQQCGVYVPGSDPTYELHLYPNPSQGNISLLGIHLGEFELTIRDHKGALVYSASGRSTGERFSLEQELGLGHYYCTIIDENGMHHIPFVVIE